MSQPLRLKGGTVVLLDGVAIQLVGDTDVDVPNVAFDALRPHSTTPYEEYPKRVVIDDVEHVAQSAAHEAELRAAAEPKRANPLDDIDIDGAAAESDESDDVASSKKKSSTKKK